MDEFSVLIGGKAGFGIDRATQVLGRLLNRAGWRICIYHDYPSLIRGGHTFSIIRAGRERVAAHRDKIDVLLALNGETIALHQNRLTEGGLVIYDSDAVREARLPEGIRTMALAIGRIVKEENGPEVMRNTCLVGAFARAAGIESGLLSQVVAESFRHEPELNVKIVLKCFAEATAVMETAPPEAEPLPLISGSQAIGLGLIRAGLQNYVAYPMTPTTPLLHFLAEQADACGLKVIQPESELGVILMALGFAYAGQRAAVGTSGGGFCLMTEALSLSGMAEIPVVIVLGQRPGPSTGLPTYSGQADLHFALSAGQGEFVRFLAAPGDLEEAYGWSARALDLAWKFQIPAIVLTDKNLNESIGNFELPEYDGPEAPPLLWDGQMPYRRYEATETGISPLAFPPNKDAVIKVNSYEHDESGITTEEPAITGRMQEKRLRKGEALAEALKGLTTVNRGGDVEGSTALLCWGSGKGVCSEAARKLGLRLVQPVVLSPFPEEAFGKALAGVQRVIAVENNATGQLARYVRSFGFSVDERILKYDGRPFFLDELEARLKEKLR
jgi:2-oxoglutarate ferredoxin oxidoreductase subunit alpha